MPAFFSISKTGHRIAFQWKSTLLKNNPYNTSKNAQQFFRQFFSKKNNYPL